MESVVIVTGILAVLIIITLMKTVKIVPQAEVQVIERLGRFHRVLSGGVNYSQLKQRASKSEA